LIGANWTPDFWLSGAELRVKKPFLVRARRRQEVGQWIGERLDLVMVAIRGRQAPHRLLPTPQTMALV
jgi:hypothetical protein